MVTCRYPKCSKLHETTELPKDEAVKAVNKNSYYHPDCYHMLQTVTKIRDTFIQKVNPMLTSQQIGALVSTVNNMVFDKGIDVDYILFALQYFIKAKPGKLSHPFGMHYIVQDRDVVAAWNKEREYRIREKMREQLANQSAVDNVECDLPVVENSFKTKNKSKFSNVLGV